MYFETNSGQISYKTYGDRTKRAIVFIHGFPFDKSMWDEQGRLLSSDHFVVAFDLRGHGESDVGNGHYLVEFIVDDLIDIMDHLGLEKACICGLSIGGYTAMRALEREPARFSGVVLCNTKSAPDTNAAKVNRANQIKMILAGKKSQFAEEMARNLFAPESFEKNSRLVERITGIMKGTDEKALVGTLIALAARMDMTESISRIAVPALIITGDKDKVATIADAESMKSRIPNSRFVLVHGAGHLSNLENPEEFNLAVMNFLADYNL